MRSPGKRGGPSSAAPAPRSVEALSDLAETLLGAILNGAAGERPIEVVDRALAAGLDIDELRPHVAEPALLALSAALEVRDEGHAPTLSMVRVKLDERGELARVGGVTYVNAVEDRLPDLANVEHYCRQLMSAAAERNIAAAAFRVQQEPGNEAAKNEMRRLLTDAPERVPRSPMRTGWADVSLETMTTPAPARRWLLRHPNGHGFVPCGVVGMIAAAGGSGKTIAVVQLAVAVATGRPWLDFFPVAESVRGRVLLVLGEDDGDEVHRKLRRVSETMGLSEEECRGCAARISTIALKGRSATLTKLDSMQVVETGNLADLRDLLHENAGPDGWSLVVLDPLARFAGADEESNNQRATAFIALVESLVETPGQPLVLLTHHSSKQAGNDGEADHRGVTGLRDGVRWGATLYSEERGVRFRLTKTNVSRRFDPLTLRWSAGILVADKPSGASWEDSDSGPGSGDIESAKSKILDVLRAHGGTVETSSALLEAVGGRAKTSRNALRLMVSSGEVIESPRNTGKGSRYSLPTPLPFPQGPEQTKPGAAGATEQAEPAESSRTERSGAESTRRPGQRQQPAKE